MNPPEKLVELLRKNVDYGRRQGLPHLLGMQQSLIVLIYELGREPGELQSIYNAALEKVKTERFEAECKRQEALAKREADWEASARAWMEQHVVFPGVSDRCQGPGKQTNVPCGGELDMHKGLVAVLRHRTNESEFGQQSQIALAELLRNCTSATGRCTKCGAATQLPASNIRTLI